MPPRRSQLTNLLLLVCMALPLLGQVQEHPRKIFLQLSAEAYENRMRSNDPNELGVAVVDDILFTRGVEVVKNAFPILKAADRDPYGLERIFVIEFADDQILSTLNSELSNLEQVEYSESIWLRELYDTQFVPNDTYFGQSWHHATVESEAAWDIQTGADSIVIAIVDTGVDLDHPDLEDNLWTNPDEIPDNGVDDDNNGFVDDFYGWDFSGSDNDVNHDWGWHIWNAEDHGTHCAGIAAAVTNNGIGVAGMAFQSKIMGVKIFPDAWDNVTAPAITYAADMGAQVQSNSWGGGGSSNTIQNAILYARDVQDCVVLFAAGNDGSSSPHYPGANSGTVCVGATNSGDNRASFSNYGTWVDVCAPGTGIWSATDPDNPSHNSYYQAWDGTSMATPLAAGIAALIRSQFPNMDVPAVEARLIDGDDVGNLQMGLRVNALKALSAFSIDHMPLANSADTLNNYIVTAEIFAGDITGLEVNLHYALSGSGFTSTAMTNSIENLWVGELPAQSPGTILEYYIEVSDGEGNTMVHPATAPEVAHFFLVGTPSYFTNLHADYAENESGWTLGLPDDDASAGIWVREDPIGTTVSGNQLQSEDDHTPSGTMCYLTGNAPFSGSNYGEEDVDSGVTTLVSPVYSVPTNAFAVVSYWRWYTNDLGDNPGSDIWQVEIGDGNGNWQNLEYTSASDNSWIQKQFLVRNYFPTATAFQFRFRASDEGNGSLVEAAIDDFSIFVGGEPPFIVGDTNLDGLLNVQDVILLVSHILGNETLQGEGALAADHNQDGVVNVQDLVTLVAVIIG